MYLLRKVLVLGCCVGLMGACAPHPGEEESANIVEKVAEDLPDQPADPSIVVVAPTMARTVFSNEWVGVAEVNQEPVFILEYLQARQPELVRIPFFAKYTSDATWFDQLEPFTENDRPFFEERPRQVLADLIELTA